MAIFIPRFLRHLRDVDTTGVADGEALTYDLGTETWVPGAGGGGGGPPTGAAGGVLGGTYPNPGFAVDMATQAELEAHVTDITDAHDATAISFAPAGTIAATNVQAAIEEAASEATADLGPAVILAPASSARNVIIPTLGTVIAMVTRAHAAQSVNLAEWQLSSGALAWGLSPEGAEILATTPIPADGDVPNSQRWQWYEDTVGIPLLWFKQRDSAGTLFEGVAFGVSTSGTPGYWRALVPGPTGSVPVLGTNNLDATNKQGYFSFAHQGTLQWSFGNDYNADGSHNFWLYDEVAAANLLYVANSGVGDVRFLFEQNIDPTAQTLPGFVHISTVLQNSRPTLVLSGGGAQTADILQIGAGGFGAYTLYSRFNKAGYLITRKTSAPADADVSAGDLAWWYDSTNGAAKWMAKGKTADGTVVTWTIPSGTSYVAGGTDVALADGGTGASLADPGADRIMFWDDSAGAVDWLTAGTNLTITGTTIDAAGASGAPSTATYITQTADAGLSAEQALSALATGLVKNTTGTGVLSIGAAGTDYAAAAHASTHANGGADEIITSLDYRAYPGAPTFLPRSGRYYGPHGPTANAGTTLNRMTLLPIFFPTAVTVDRIGVRVIAFASTAVCRLGIYDDTGDGYPGALILDAGTIDGSGSNASREITISQALTPGVKWLAAAIQVASATYMGMQQQQHFFVGYGTLNSATQFPGSYFADSISGALPNPYVGITDNNTANPIRVVVRVT